MSINPPINRNQVKSILIVEDNDMLLELLVKGFKMLGMDVFKANNGLDGWNQFKSCHVDVVLTDVQMPGMDGIELSIRIRNTSPNTTIALMTGTDADIAKKLLDDGIANHLFLKPFPLSSICKKLAAEAQMV